MYLSPSRKVSFFKTDKARLSAAERASTCLKAPYDSNSYQVLIWSARVMSSTTHLKQDEFDLKNGVNGPLKTQPIGRRTAHGEIESYPRRYSTGLMAW